MSKNKKLKYPILVLSTIFLTLAVWTFILSWSEILTIRPQKVLNLLNKDQDVEYHLIHKMSERLKTSINLNPNSANSHLLLAQFYEYLGESTRSRDNINYLLLSEKEYNEAAYLQPTWDIAWAKLAKFYDKNNNKNKMFYALKKATLLGTFEYDTQEIIIPMLFQYWDLVAKDKEFKKQSLKLFEHALEFHQNALLLLSTTKKFNKLEIIEPLLKKEWHINQFKKYKHNFPKPPKNSNDQ